MNGDRQNLLMRREILEAYVAVLTRSDELLRVCSASSGDETDVKSAVVDAFNVSEVAADAILALQVRRFTPAVLKQIQLELADVERDLAADRT